MSGVPWTDPEDDILRDMAAAGYKAADVARVLKSRSLVAIGFRSRVLGVSLAGKPPEIDWEAFKRIIGKTEKPKCV